MISPLRCLTLCSLLACASCGDAPVFALDEGRSAAPLRHATDEGVLQSGRAECDVRELARLPDARSNTPSVQEYAGVIQREHGNLFINLRQLLQQRGAALPYEMSDAGAEQEAQLANEAGSSFDRAYLAGQVQLQQEAQVTLGELQQSADGGVRGWAQQAAGVWGRDEAWARQIYASILIDTDIGGTHTEP